MYLLEWEIQFSIYNNFSVFCEDFNLEIENIFKFQPQKTHP